ncbi:hypothetical protein LOH54_07080 [Sulfurimonas sp. HSL-3221]|uniref:hypothetical protein n=1 Tax=Sulfurimonadaceae TaxID=2771471 RepID=UPI001E3F4E6F|nr:hypothetical protein [Sulfurimonas sp. HSL-3221]UFS61423.1 hypothetical protein LOH54_07080 [Sulfurimonas sp. HSL-3221]
MKRTIFYSWQSDLPNNTNWSFIETCLSSATKELKKIQPVSIVIDIDRATRQDTGSPDITESIFTKITNSSVFVADVSIVNGTSNGRKTPNPNVLIELGYAARTLGWEKIICICNTDFGDLTNLPFDLRNRRIMTYSLKDKNKSDVKREVSNGIKKAVMEMHSKGILTDKILDYLKKEIDQEMLILITHLVRFINKSSEKTDFLEDVTAFLNYEKKDIIEILKNKKTIGFYLLKSFHEHEKKFNTFINQAMGSQYYNREILNALIDIYEWFSAYNDMRSKYFSNLLIKLEKTEDRLHVINSSEVTHNSPYSDRYFLMKKINEKESQVHNVGDFYPGNVPDLLNYYEFNSEYLDKYADTMTLLSKNFNNWLQLTNNEFILDFVKTFRVKQTNGEWL